MTWVELFARLFIYGFGGLCLEVLFTGLHSLIIDKNPRAVCTTYLWMNPIYFIGGIGLEWLHGNLSRFLFIPLALFYIYTVEFSFGFLIQKLIKRKLWDYGNAKYGVLGLIRIDYAPFWLTVVVFFDMISTSLMKLFKLINYI